MTIQVRFGDHVPSGYAAIRLMLPLPWMLTLWLSGACEDRHIGIGIRSGEFRRVLNAGVSLTAGLAILSYAVNTEMLDRVAAGIALILLALLFLRRRWRSGLPATCPHCSSRREPGRRGAPPRCNTFRAMAVDAELPLGRPPPALLDEAPEYADHVQRRLVAKPVITSLWQVNGRSGLS